MWLVELLRRYDRLTRSEINSHWRRSTLGNGRDLPRRSFFNIRDEVEELMQVSIQCDPATYEYYLEELDPNARNITSWLVHTSTLNDVLSGARDVSHLIFMEDVPSARSYLKPVAEALKDRNSIRFDYAPYSRSTPSRGVELEPYFLKLFKQRWYVTGRAVRDGDTIKTYALDRMQALTTLNETYEIPEDFHPEDYFKDSFGIVFTHGDVKDIKLKVDSRQAKYFRALPLHPSQQEMIHDTYSIFTYRMKISADFVQELLSHGPRVTVISPPELKAMIVNDLHQSLANYSE